MPAVSPGQIWLNFANEYYPSDEAFVFAAAEALANEYRAIVDAGFVLQLDDPGLAMGWNRAEFADRTLEDYRRIVAQHVEAINHRPATAFPPIASACTCAGATASGRTCATCRSAAIVDLLYRGQCAGRCTSKAPIRATATSGGSSKSTRCPTARC